MMQYNILVILHQIDRLKEVFKVELIKYVAVCKRGYIFATTKEDIKKFIDERGKDLAYYIGYFKPLENLDFISNPNTNIKELADVVDE